MLHLELVCLQHQQNKVLTVWVVVTDRLLFHLAEHLVRWGFCAHSQRRVLEMTIVGIPALTVIVLFTESRKKLSELII